MPKNNKKLWHKIKELKALEDENSLRWYVLNYIQENYQDNEEIISFFQDLSGYGCQSGMVGGLIYYSDTHQFYDRYYEDIEWLRQEWKENTGEPLKIKGDLKNHLAWFAFEEISYQIARHELNLEI